jgi:hypothetical protein
MMNELGGRRRLTARRGLFEVYRREQRSVWIQASGVSMRPLISPGEWMLVAFGEQPKRAGEIVLVDDGIQIVAHRVVAKQGGGQLVTKGDASRSFDRPISPETALGVVRARRRSETAVARRTGCTGDSAFLIAKLSLLIGVLFERCETLGRAWLSMRSKLHHRP